MVISHPTGVMMRLGDMGICKVFPKVLVNAADLAEAYTTCGTMHNGPPSCIPFIAKHCHSDKCLRSRVWLVKNCNLCSNKFLNTTELDALDVACVCSFSRHQFQLPASTHTKSQHWKALSGKGKGPAAT